MTVENGDGDRQRDHRHHEAVLDLMREETVVDGDFDDAVRSITETAARTVGCTFASIWLFDDGDHVRCVDRYDSRTDDHTAGTELHAAAYPTYFEALRTHRSISAVDARSDPRTRELASDYLEPAGIDSLLDATLRADGDVIGMVCHEQLGECREWTDAEVQFAGDVADVVHRALRNHRRAERRRELEVRRSLLEAQQEAMPEGVLVVGDDGDVLSWNTKFRDLWDLPRDVLEESRDGAVFDHIRPQLAEPNSVLEPDGTPVDRATETGHDEVVLEDGRVFEVYSTPVRGDDDEQYGRLWLVRDVTDRTERQEELELKNRAIDEAPIGITLSAPDDDNPVIYANEQFERLTGYARDDVLGRNCRFLQGDRTEREPVDELRAAIEAERPSTVELRNYRKDGSEFWNRVTIAPVANDEGDVTNYVGFQQDVTERKEATRQLRVLHRVLRHNLSNQMSIIRGTAEQLLDQPTATEGAAETIIEETDQLLGFTDKHRSIVRLLSERPSSEPIDIEPLCRRLVRTVGADFPDAELALEGEPEATVSAIPDIDTAIRELVENGLAYSDRSPATVALRVDRRPETVRIRITDNGPGLPEEEAQILTGDQSVEPLYHGLGMGLWLVYWIVTLSRGTITVEETGPDGTTVRLEFSRVDDRE
ncbi:PAS domain-containing protein [Natrinema salsiterrestre]|uniref:PAS domain-containing protein n=1 Tax=Natrinema salsiterrestre TaxID=2950540 RepID=A0A9Q4L0D5_9EURY|nr:PAS domain-containing protein [Natrinema salsiterrestre]MDF9744493.1 PAS domain-containing protein [Natrinema salsiterrestre]